MGGWLMEQAGCVCGRLVDGAGWAGGRGVLAGVLYCGWLMERVSRWAQGTSRCVSLWVADGAG